MKCFMTNQECIHESELRESFEQKCNIKSKKNSLKTIFVISPFGYPYDDLYQEAIMSLKKAGKFEVQRADRAVQLGFVMCQKICKEIRKADIVLVDLSEPNPNVYYELGLAFGFGKDIVFLFGDEKYMNDNYLRPWMKFIENRNLNFLNYRHLQQLGSEKPNYDFFINLIKKYKFNSNSLTETFRDPSSYIEQENTLQKSNKQLLFCLSTPMYDKKMLIDSATIAIKNLKWNIIQYDLNDPLTVGRLLNMLKNCKVCMIDVSHYSDSVNPFTYWVLGVAHSLGRDSIPITNRSRSDGNTPFDIRGLYQIYFESLDSFRENLSKIMEVINHEYEKEIRDYPQKYVWDGILSPNYNLEVITFGRGNQEDPTRKGGRTNVDRWDYQAVAKLAFFLAQKYKQATVVIQPPEDRRVTKRKEIKERITSIKRQLCDGKNYIIVGSPDVSDYAEIVLSTAYGISPYNKLDCDNASCKGNLCDKKCIGRKGYIFQKMSYFVRGSQKREIHPRAKSFCYRDAKKVKDEGVLWYGKMYPCQNDVSYGVITICYKNPILKKIKQKNNVLSSSSIVVLSGFTGIATFGLAELLAGDNKDEAEELKRHLRKYKNEDAIGSIQVLVRVEYSQKNVKSMHESRVFKNIYVEDVQPLQKISS